MNQPLRPFLFLGLVVSVACASCAAPPEEEAESGAHAATVSSTELKRSEITSGLEGATLTAKQALTFTGRSTTIFILSPEQYTSCTLELSRSGIAANDERLIPKGDVYLIDSGAVKDLKDGWILPLRNQTTVGGAANAIADFDLRCTATPLPDLKAIKSYLTNEHSQLTLKTR